MKKENYYPLGISQSTINMQSVFSKHKEVLNINLAFTPKQNWDYETFCIAFEKVIERNDCMRLVFKPKFMNWNQKFLEELKAEIPVLDFTGKTESEQKAKLEELAKTPLAHKKGQSFRVFFCNTFNGKTLIYLNVSHLILDIYGLVYLVDDMNNVYTAVSQGEEMPELPSRYEDSIKSDFEYLSSPKCEKDAQYYEEFFKSLKGTRYIGMHGMDSEYWVKRKRKGKAMKMFMFKNETNVVHMDLDDKLVKQLVKVCEEYKQNLSLFMYVAYMVALSYLNEKEQHVLALNLCNARLTNKELRCGGCKVQSLPIALDIEQTKTFKELLAEASSLERTLLKHLHYPELKRQGLMHKGIGTTQMETSFPFTYSFLPMTQSDKYEFEIFTSGRFILPGYLAVFYDSQKQKMKASYTYQLVVSKAEQIKKYHETAVKALTAIAENPELTISQLFGKLD